MSFERGWRTLIRNASEYRDLRRWTLLVVSSALAAGLGLVACGAEATSSSHANPSETDRTSAPVTPDLQISVYQQTPDLSGDQLLLSDIVGLGKPIVLNFWAASCPPCRAEMPGFQRVYERRHEEVTVLGVDIGPQQSLGSRAQGQRLVEELGVRYLTGTTFDEDVVPNYQIVAMPMTLFIATDGNILRSWSGLLSEEKLNALIDDLVASQ